MLLHGLQQAVDRDGDGNANDDLDGSGAVDAADTPATYCGIGGAGAASVDNATGLVTNNPNAQCLAIGCYCRSRNWFCSWSNSKLMLR